MGQVVGDGVDGEELGYMVGDNVLGLELGL